MIDKSIIEVEAILLPDDYVRLRIVNIRTARVLIEASVHAKQINKVFEVAALSMEKSILDSIE